MRHGLKWFIHPWAQRPRVGDEHPAYAPARAWLPLPLQAGLRLQFISNESEPNIFKAKAKAEASVFEAKAPTFYPQGVLKVKDSLGEPHRCNKLSSS